MILFSILVPVYNVEKYLSRCIYSVLEQTYPYFELILIDDGSTDRSGTICDRYALIDNRIKVYHQPNQGIVTARRSGMVMATGDYYLFLDSDDFWDIDLLDTVYKAIDYYGCDMIIFNYKRITRSGAYINKPVFENGTIFDSENKDLIFEEVIKGNKLNNIWTKAVNRSLVNYEEYSKNKKLRNAEDLLLSLPLLYKAKRILYLDKAMYNYRMNPTSITHSFRVNKVKDVTIVSGKILKYLKLLNMNQEKYKTQYYHTYINNLLNYITNLNESKLNIVTKKKIMKCIQHFKLYQNALPYINGSYFSYHQKILFFLYSNKYYTALFLYVNTIIKVKQYLSALF